METRLFRRISPREGDGWVRDENNDCIRLSSAAFVGDRMSVLLGDTMESEGRPPQDALAGHPDFFLVSITAADARAQEQEIERTPLPDEPAHGDVVGKKARKRRRALRDAAKWVQAPDGLCPDEKLAA